MTIAISIKVNDGVILASDSAATILGKDPLGRIGVVKVYENANKIFNFLKGTPIGAITWGSGSIGQASISTLAKDFRKELSDPNSEWHIDSKNYTIESIVNNFKKFIYDDKYNKAFEDWVKVERPSLGFVIVGYSSGETLAEEWIFQILKGECEGPKIIRAKEETGLSWNGQIEAISRLYFGVSPILPNILTEYIQDNEKIKEIVNKCQQGFKSQMVIPAMPIQDAIDLAKFLVELTINYTRFCPGASVVGGPIEVAAITKHEGFKWVQRKHYYDIKYNPEPLKIKENGDSLK